jgi:hypothetical protein
VRRSKGFTIVELLVSVVVLVLLVLLMSRLFSSAATVITSGNKRLDAEAQVRPLFDRMAVDFSQMIKRSDVDYYLKSSANAQAGNDQIAFYSAVPGYYPSGSQSPVSVVAYRINSTAGSANLNKLERMAKGLLWNGVSPSPSPSSTPIVFLPSTISTSWPAATNTTIDSDYELTGPYVFRFEYYYLLKGGTYFDAASNQYKTLTPILSDTPWDIRSPLSHTAVNGMQDVAAVAVSIAAIDPKSRVLISDSQLTTLTGGLVDFSPSMKPGDLLGQWQAALDATTDMPRPAIQAVRIYERYFYLLPKS